MTPDDFEELYRVTRDEAMKSKPPSMTPAEFEDAIRKAGDSAMKKRVEEMKSEDSASAGNACSYCQQNLHEAVCKHWVATLSYDSECCLRDVVTPLYFQWVDYWNDRREEMIGLFDSYFESLCAVCDQITKAAAEQRQRAFNNAEDLPAVEKTIVIDAVELLASPGAREYSDATQNVLADLDSQFENLFSDLFLRFKGKRSKADHTIYNLAGSWRNTHYCADPAEECVECIIRECRSATDRLRRLI